MSRFRTPSWWFAMRWWLPGFALLLLLPSTSRSEDPPSYLRHFGRTGSARGLFRSPAGAAVDASGHIFVVEISSCRVQKFTADGTYLSGWGARGAEPGHFELPTDIAIDAAQRLWVVDRGNDRLQCFDSSGNFLAAYGTTGHGAGQFYVPGGVAIRGSRLAVADTWNHRICLFEIVGTRLEPVFVLGDSGSANGQFLAPQDVDLGPDGSIYVADSDNNRVQVFDSQGTYLRRLGTITRFQWVYGVGVDAHGNAYVSEPTRSQISKLTQEGRYLYTWGSVGPKVQKFVRPLRITFDRDGMLVVVDYDDTRHNDRIVIWRPADAVTPVEATSWSDVRRIYRGR